MLVGVVATIDWEAKRGYRDGIGGNGSFERYCSKHGNHRVFFRVPSGRGVLEANYAEG